jgi:hypothetical protein
MAQPLSKPPVADQPPKHVIAEYKHRAQLVTCVCGWQGSSATPDARPSEWSTHIAAYRTGRR